MKYYVKFELDYYVEGELVAFSYSYGYSYPVGTISEAIRDQELIRKKFMNHEPFAIFECDKNGLVTNDSSKCMTAALFMLAGYYVF